MLRSVLAQSLPWHVHLILIGVRGCECLRAHSFDKGHGVQSRACISNCHGFAGRHIRSSARHVLAIPQVVAPLQRKHECIRHCSKKSAQAVARRDSTSGRQ
eukprot:10793204-Karenia_brevis.AAC.1